MKRSSEKNSGKILTDINTNKIVRRNNRWR